MSDLHTNVPVLLLLDQSGSMSESYGGSRKIDKLNEGVKVFCQTLYEHGEKNGLKYTIRMLSFDTECHECRSSSISRSKFVPVAEFVRSIPRIANTNLATLIGASISVAIKDLQEEKERLSSHTIPYKQPVLVVFTDGRQECEQRIVLEESIEQALQKIAEGWCIVVVATNMDQSYKQILSEMVTPTINDGKVLECADAADIVKKMRLVSRSISVLPLRDKRVEKSLTGTMR